MLPERQEGPEGPPPWNKAAENLDFFYVNPVNFDKVGNSLSLETLGEFS